MSLSVVDDGSGEQAGAFCVFLFCFGCFFVSLRFLFIAGMAWANAALPATRMAATTTDADEEEGVGGRK